MSLGFIEWEALSTTALDNVTDRSFTGAIYDPVSHEHF